MSLMRTIGEFGENIISKPENLALAIAILLFFIAVAVWGW